MKQLVTNYLFDPVNGVVTLTDFSTIDIGRLLLIANATRGTIIYNFADASVGSATLVTSNSVDLSYDTSLMSASDKLTIYYEFGALDPVTNEPPQRVVVEHDVQPVEVDLQIDGIDLRSDSPGVLTTSIVGPTGDAVDTVNGSLMVTNTKAGDAVVGGSPVEIVTGQRVVGSFKEVCFSKATATANFTPWIDAAAYRSVSVHLSVGAVTATFQGSNDGVNAVSVSLVNVAAIGASVPAVSGVGPAVFSGTLRTRYFRLSLSAVACQGVITFFTEPQDFAGAPAGSLTAPPASVTPAIAGLANNPGVPSATYAQLNEPSAAGAIGTWFPQVDVKDGRFSPVPVAGAPVTTSHTGLGVAAAGLVGVYDDVAPNLPLENTVGRIRVSKNRHLLTGMKDASPQALEQGVGVSSRMALQVEDVRSGQFGNDPILQVQPGQQGVTLVGETGDVIGTTGSSLNVTDVTPDVARIPFMSVGSTSGQLAGVWLLAIIATNINASLRYLQIFDNDGLTGVPTWSIPIPAGTATAPGSVSLGSEFLGPRGTGNGGTQYWAISTSATAYVAATGSDHTVNGACR